MSRAIPSWRTASVVEALLVTPHCIKSPTAAATNRRHEHSSLSHVIAIDISKTRLTALQLHFEAAIWGRTRRTVGYDKYRFPDLRVLLGMGLRTPFQFPIQFLMDEMNGGFQYWVVNERRDPEESAHRQELADGRVTS